MQRNFVLTFGQCLDMISSIEVINLKDVSLLEGSVTKSLWLFSLPMILGNLLQQLYNIADTLIVGRYLGSDALAAVGSSFTLMVFLTSIILGLCMGSGVLFSMLYGSQKEKHLKNAFFVSFVAIGLLTIIIEVFCLLFAKEILVLLNIPQKIFEATYSYTFIVFIGLVFTFIYNYFSSLLRALGDSKTPLLFLAVSSIINIVLDIYFIVALNSGIAGAAYATIIAQAISAIGLVIYIAIKKKELHIQKEHCYLNHQIFKKMMDYSLLTCFQQSVMNLGILMIQGLVNSFGVVTMSAFAAAVKIDAFAYMPVQDFGNAFATFIAQNKGAQANDRIAQGLKSALLTSSIFCLFISFVIYVFASELMTIFIDSSEINVIAQGVEYLRIEGICYIGIGCLFLLYGYYRGIGKPAISVVLTIISLGTRVVLAYLLAPTLGTIAIWWAIPIGWFLADATGIIYGLKHEKWHLAKNC